MNAFGRDRVTAASPYKGLEHFTEDDAAIFFGRARERDVVIANVTARRLTILCGASGVGKSSLLRAGVVRNLRDAAERDFADEEVGRPEYVPAIVSSWTGDPARTIVDTLASAIAPFARESVPATLPAQLDAAIEALAARADTRVLLILDQLEEYFLYHPGDGGGPLDEELPRALGRRDLRASFLLSIREDALAKLNRFKRGVPGLYDTVLRIGPLDRKAGEQAIVAPLRAFEGAGPKAAEPALVKTVLDEVAAGRLVLEGTGQGRVGGDGAARAEPAIEAAYLQVVLEQLWAEETDPKMLRLATLRRLGGAKSIVRRHLDDALDRLDERERLVAADALRYLVTPSGTKIALDAVDLASFTGRRRTDVASVLERLTSAQARILHAVGDPLGKSDGTRYEIAHDVLGAAVLDWRSRFLQTQERERQIAANRERVRRLRRWTAGLAAAVLVIGGIAAVMIFLWHSARVQKQRADQEAAKARHALVNSVLADVVTDPAAALVAARGAVHDEETPETLDALRAALIASHERTRTHIFARYAALMPDDRYAFVVPRNGPPHLRDLATMRIARTLGRRVARGGALSIDGRWVVTIPGGRAPRVWPRDGTRSWPLRGARDVQTVSFSADGGFVVATSAGRARVWRTATGTPLGRPVRQKEVLDAVLSRGAGLLVTGSEDGKVRVWGGRSGKRLYTLATEGGIPRAVAISPDGRFVAAATSGGARIWDLSESPELGPSATCGASETSTVSFADNSRLLLTGRADGKTAVCNVLGEPIVTLVGHRGAVETAAFDSRARRVITAGADGTVRTWAVGAIVLPGPTSDAAFDQSGKRVATETLEGIRVWDADSGRRLPVRSFGTHDALASALSGAKKTAVSPDGHLLAAANDNSVELRDPRTNRHLLELSGASTVVAVAFDRAGSKLLVARAATGATLYDCSGCGAASELRKRAAQVVVRCPPNAGYCP